MMFNSTEKHMPIYSFKSFIKMVNCNCIVKNIVGDANEILMDNCTNNICYLHNY